MAFVLLKCLLSIYLITPHQTSLVASQTPSGDYPSQQNGSTYWSCNDGDEAYDAENIRNILKSRNRNCTATRRHPIPFGDFILRKSHVRQGNWVDVVSFTHTTISSVGLVANLVTMVTIVKHGEDFSLAVRVLLTHQALVDGLACAMATAMSLQPDYIWKINNFVIYYILCRFWHSEAIYWAVIMVSIWNLVLMAIERYIAVHYPFASVNRKHIVGTFVVMYVFFALYLLLSGFLRTDFHFGRCGILFLPIFQYYWSITNLFVFYLIPMVCFVVLYSRIVYTLRIGKRQGSAGQAVVFDAASATLLRMGIAVTSVFAFAIGYAQWYFTLVFTDTIPHGFKSPQERAAIVLNTCNVVANPFVYGFMLPAFRRSLKKTFGCAFVWQKYGVGSSTTVEMTPQTRRDTGDDAGSSTKDVSVNTNVTHI